MLNVTESLRRKVRRCPLLEVDPGLAQAVAPEQRPLAGRALLADVQDVERGPWPLLAEELGGECSGYLVASGFLLRRVTLLGSQSVEPLGPGDLLRPWQDDAVSFVDAEITVVIPSRLAALDRDLIARAARFPDLIDALMERATQRSRFMAVSAAIDGVVGVDRRLSALMWTLAERWGEVRDGRVFLPLDLQHEDLAGLVAARRPSVSTALADLQRAGTLERTRGGWLLNGDPPASSP
jgi:CRP-like cAMP-binding protein